MKRETLGLHVTSGVAYVICWNWPSSIMQIRIPDRGHIPALDGIRGISALAVVFFHIGIPWAPGQLAVQCFFVLSGLLITWLLLGELERTETISLRRFYARRTLRIFPPFYAFLIVAVCCRPRPPAGSSISAALYVYNYFHGICLPRPSRVDLSWSLGIEEQFYLLWPVILLTLHSLNRQALLQRLAIAFLIVQIGRIVAVALGVRISYVDYAFETRCDALLAGCMAAIALRSAPHIPSLILHRLAPLVPILSIVACQWATMQWPDFEQTYLHGIEALSFAVLIVQCIALSKVRPWSWLDLPPLRALGLISYSLYLWHIIGLFAADHVHTSRWRYQILTDVVASLVLATGSYLIIERPFDRLKQRLATRKRYQPATM